MFQLSKQIEPVYYFGFGWVGLGVTVLSSTGDFFVVYMALAMWVEGVEWFLLANSSVFASSTARLDSTKWEGTIVSDMHCFANMVESRENMAN